MRHAFAAHGPAAPEAIEEIPAQNPHEPFQRADQSALAWDRAGVSGIDGGAVRRRRG
jgi:hypothetical protein